MTSRAKQRILAATALLPAVWLLLLYLFVLRARIHLGHWPSSADGMAKYLGFPIHHTLTVDAFLAAPLAAIFVAAAVIIFRYRDSRIRIVLPIAILAICSILSISLLVTDPGGLILWFVD